MSLFDSEENPADAQFKSKEDAMWSMFFKVWNEDKDKPMPKWFGWFLVGAILWLVISCGLLGNAVTSDTIKSQPRTYQSFEDYKMFLKNEK